MIDRSYLPFKSAREYQDRQMAKWMGFFLSEHSTALSNPNDEIDFNNALSFNKKLQIISQLFINGLKADFEVVFDNKRQTIIGTVTQFQDTVIGVQSQCDYFFVDIKNILSIKLHEENAGD